MQEIQFDFFRGMEAEQYTFYRIPKILFTAECFRSLSCEAKVLYGLLLDRMSLSIKNRWLDEEDRVYIVFKVEEIVELMDCGTQKATKLLKELDADKGIGLIEKKRQGLGKPNVIYVKNFMIRQDGSDEPEKEHIEKQVETQNCENQNSRVVETTSQEVPKPQNRNSGGGDTEMVEDICQETKTRNKEAQDLEAMKNINLKLPLSQMQDCESQNPEMMETAIPEFLKPQVRNGKNQNSRMMKTIIPEFLKPQVQNGENQNSGMMNITILECPKSQSNNTDISDIYISENKYRETDLKETESDREESTYPNPIRSNPSIPGRIPDVIERMDACRDVIRENISYECFQNERYHRTDEVDELIELMVEVMLMPDDAVLRIAGTEKPAAIVKSRFMKLNQGHMEYIMSCLVTNRKKVANMKAYLLTVLYNATLTINNYYTAEVSHALC